MMGFAGKDADGIDRVIPKGAVISRSDPVVREHRELFATWTERDSWRPPEPPQARTKAKAESKPEPKPEPKPEVLRRFRARRDFDGDSDPIGRAPGIHLHEGDEVLEKSQPYLMLSGSTAYGLVTSVLKEIEN